MSVFSPMDEVQAVTPYVMAVAASGPSQALGRWQTTLQVLVDPVGRLRHLNAMGGVQGVLLIPGDALALRKDRPILAHLIVGAAAKSSFSFFTVHSIRCTLRSRAASTWSAN